MARAKRMLIAPIDIRTWYYDEISIQTADKRLMRTVPVTVRLSCFFFMVIIVT